MATQAQEKQDFEKPYLRARRTLRHLWSITRGDLEFNPNKCDGCKEIHRFLTDPTYLGDEHYPIGVESDADLGPNWYLGPDEMELPTRPTSNPQAEQKVS